MDFTLTLVRHGESEANVRHMLSGWMDVPLTDHGRKELERLKRSVDYPLSDVYFSSPLRRCIDTSGILFPGEKPIISESFKEINFRSLEGYILSSAEDVRRYFSSWVEDKPLKDEETISDVMKRGSSAILKTVSWCEENGKHSALIVMHSGIMRASLISLFGMEKRCFLDMVVPNGLGYVISFNDLEPVSYEKIK